VRAVWKPEQLRIISLGAEVVAEVVNENIAVPGTQKMSIKISLDGRRLDEYSETLLRTTLDV